MEQYQLFDQAAKWSSWENVEGENTFLIYILALIAIWNGSFSQA